MPYIESITKAGKTIEIERYYTSRYGKRGQTRADRVKATKEEQKKVNTRQAEKKLRRLMNANFTSADYHIVLDYIHKKGEPYRTKEEMKNDIAVFLRKLRKECRAAGQELKYIHVMEIGEKGARHHHLVINHIDTIALQRCWTLSRVKVFPLDTNGQYGQLAAYFIKYTDKTVGTEDELQGKRWNCSKNLIRPIPEIKIISCHAWYKSEPTIPHRYAGKYYIDKSSVSKGVHSSEYGGYGYFRFTLIQNE